MIPNSDSKSDFNKNDAKQMIPKKVIQKNDSKQWFQQVNVGLLWFSFPDVQKQMEECIHMYSTLFIRPPPTVI